MRLVKNIVQLLVFSTLLWWGCGENPLGVSELDSTFDPGTTADIVEPTPPLALSLTGFATLTSAPVLNWTAGSDETAVGGYEIAIGTTSGGQEVAAFTDVGDVVSYQVTGLSTNLTANSVYFLSLKTRDSSGNYSSVVTSLSFAPALSQTTSAFHYPDSTYAVSCSEYINSDYYNAEGDGLYWVDPDGGGANPQIQVHCDMTRDGGGWTLAFSRRGGADNTETCGANLNVFLQAPCGAVANIGYADSYNLGDTSVREDLIDAGEFMFLQFDNFGVLDSDDAHIIHHTTDLWPSSTGVINRYAVSKICDVDNTNCDSTGAEFLWSGNGFFSSARCNGGFSGSTYYGNYGYCQDGNTGADANSLFGNRMGYDETKLWAYTPRAGDFYQEMVFIR